MTSPASDGHLLPYLLADGPAQMALDGLLLEQADTTPSLRFYSWDGPWLSLGRNQRHWPAHWDELAAAGELSLVHRPSGGQAVLHAGGLTYALIWPHAPRRRRQAYREACQWLIHGFQQLGETLRFGDDPAQTDEKGNCFSSATAADLVDGRGVKRIGSAQRWKRGHLLQHGEILLDPPDALWEAVFMESPPPPAPASILRQDLKQILIAAMKQQWRDLRWNARPFNARECQALGWAGSVSEACIDSTTCGSITRPKG